MRRCGRGVKVVGLLIFLTRETRWFSVGIGSVLRLDNYLILFSLKCYYAFFLVCCGCDASYIVSVHIQCQTSYSNQLLF